MGRLIRNLRKMSEARQEKLDRLHMRDCPGWKDIEFSCAQCQEIRARTGPDGTPRASSEAWTDTKRAPSLSDP